MNARETNTFGPMNNVERKSTGRYYCVVNKHCACFGAVGEAVKFWGWGGIDIKIAENDIRTLAISDVVEILTLEALNVRP